MPLTVAEADGTVDAAGAIYAAAANHNVSPVRMLRVATCESRLNPYTRGDHGGSLGLFQLSSLDTGLLRHFYFVGYDDWTDAEQQADYFARVLAGDFLPGGPFPAPLDPYGIVSVDRWSCK